jgi:hypothetical protein
MPPFHVLYLWNYVNCEAISVNHEDMVLPWQLEDENLERFCAWRLKNYFFPNINIIFRQEKNYYSALRTQNPPKSSSPSCKCKTSFSQTQCLHVLKIPRQKNIETVEISIVNHARTRTFTEIFFCVCRKFLQ